jgi:hypothetical protein
MDDLQRECYEQAITDAETHIKMLEDALVTTSTPIPRPLHLPKGSNPRYWQGAWFTPGGRVITGFLDDHIATQLMKQRPAIRRGVA